jgi:hypothetical protein
MAVPTIQFSPHSHFLGKLFCVSKHHICQWDFNITSDGGVVVSGNENDCIRVVISGVGWRGGVERREAER